MLSSCLWSSIAPRPYNEASAEMTVCWLGSNTARSGAGVRRHLISFKADHLGSTHTHALFFPNSSWSVLVVSARYGETCSSALQLPDTGVCHPHSGVWVLPGCPWIRMNPWVVHYVAKELNLVTRELTLVVVESHSRRLQALCTTRSQSSCSRCEIPCTRMSSNIDSWLGRHGTYQKLELALSIENTQAPASWARTWSTAGNGWRFLRTLLFIYTLCHHG